MRIARGVGANRAVTGGITMGDGVYVMDVGARDVATGRLLKLFTDQVRESSTTPSPRTPDSSAL